MSNSVTENTVKYPTIRIAARILGISRKRLDQLYKAGKTSSVRIDSRGIRRYPPEALIQAQRALKPTYKVSQKNYKNFVLLAYLIGAAITLMVQPQIISFLGASISLVFINCPANGRRGGRRIVIRDGKKQQIGHF